LHRIALIAVWAACHPAHQQALEDLARLEDAMQGYESWGQHAEWTGVVESLDGTHGSHVQIWFDDAFLATLNAADGGEMPVGAVAVKQGYGDSEGLDEKKRLAHQRQSDGSLFFAVWDESGEVEDFGRPETCTDCHALGQDEVMALTW